MCCGENITFHQVAKFSVPLQFMLPKLKTDDMKTGKKVYLKSGKVQLTNSDSDPLVGVVWADAGTSAEEVPVKLNV
ncbi:hypothetical protein AWP56_27045 [Escherichia coli]|nr:hypothetical protein AWP56_27045 [Escherichia coli]